MNIFTTFLLQNRDIMLNLSLNYPSVPKESEIFREYTHQLNEREQYDLLHPPYEPLDAYSLSTLGSHLRFDPAAVSVTPVPSANSGLFTIARYHRRLTEGVAIEPFTFPGWRMIAEEAGFGLHVVEADGEGMLPEKLAECLERHGCKLIYLQPTIHNPTNAVMSLERRMAIVNVVRSFPETFIIEDDAYRFLHADPPPSFLELAPDITIHVYSLSKPFNPLLRSGYIIHPEHLMKGAGNFIKMTCSGTSTLFSRLGIYLMANGMLELLADSKREAATAGRLLMEDFFRGVEYYSHPNSFHYWIPCREPEKVTASLQRRQIDISNGKMFSLTDDDQFIRVALGGAYDAPNLPEALRTIAGAL